MEYSMRRAASSSSLFIGLLIGETCLLYLVRWPLLYSFNNFAFWDSGAYFVAHYLLQQGHRPFSYFGWQYGLLPLLVQELGFYLLGATPLSFISLSVPCVIVVAVAMGRIALIEGGVAGRLLVLVSLPFILAFPLDQPHSLEAALLSSGLLSQAQAKYGPALAFATAAAFTKPSMGYLYGLVLLACVFGKPFRQILPAAQGDTLSPGKSDSPAISSKVLVAPLFTGLALIIVLATVFGWKAVLQSMLPISGARAYQALHYGWRGIPQGLLYFPGVRPGYYVGTPAAFWLCGSLYLVVAAFLVMRRMSKTHAHAIENSALVLTCAALHLGFIVLFYGSAASWTYYAYILVIGIIATQMLPVAGETIAIFCVMAVVANYSGMRNALSSWQGTERSSVTAGLFARPAERTEWNCVGSLTRQGQTAIFTNFGEAPLLFSWLMRPVGAFILPGIANAGEIAREQQQLQTANAIVLPVIPGMENSTNVSSRAEFTRILKQKTLVFKGQYFRSVQGANFGSPEPLTGAFTECDCCMFIVVIFMVESRHYSVQ